jgi:hypothetical protein
MIERNPLVEMGCFESFEVTRDFIWAQFPAVLDDGEDLEMNEEEE